MKKSKLRREKLQQLESARQDVLSLRGEMEKALSVFNATPDPELVETSILELRALEARYSHALRVLKSISEA